MPASSRIYIVVASGESVNSSLTPSPAEMLVSSSKFIRGIAAVAVVVAAARPAVAQQADSTKRTTLAPVRVSVTRETARSTLDLPFALSRLAIDSVRPGIRRASLTEMLLGVPGLAISNRHNPSQEPRLAVRGLVLPPQAETKETAKHRSSRRDVWRRDIGRHDSRDWMICKCEKIPLASPEPWWFCSCEHCSNTPCTNH